MIPPIANTPVPAPPFAQQRILFFALVLGVVAMAGVIAFLTNEAGAAQPGEPPPEDLLGPYVVPVAAALARHRRGRHDDKVVCDRERRGPDDRADHQHEAHPQPVCGHADAGARAGGHQRECAEAPQDKRHAAQALEEREIDEVEQRAHDRQNARRQEGPAAELGRRGMPVDRDHGGQMLRRSSR